MVHSGRSRPHQRFLRVEIHRAIQVTPYLGPTAVVVSGAWTAASVAKSMMVGGTPVRRTKLERRVKKAAEQVK